MKRKAAVALTLAALMAVTTIMPVFAADHTLDETDSGPQDFSEDTDDVNVTVAEGHTANVESIDAGSNNLSIGGGGTLNVDAPSGDGISVPSARI